MKIHRPSHHQSGLTLLELLVVLTILVALSTVAITSTSGVADQARYEATQRTLENIRDAVIGPANLRDTDGTLLYTGFVADTGRLPKAVAEVVDGGTVLTLQELWIQPGTLVEYDVRPALAANIVVDTPSSAAEEEDAVVYLGTGWRGPYLNLKPGTTRIVDGWGSEIATPVGIVQGYPNNLLLNSAVPVNVGDQINEVLCLGRDSAIGGAEAYDRDSETTFPSSLLNGTISVQVEVRTPDGAPAPIPVPNTTGAPIGKIFVRLFEPYSSNVVPDPSNRSIQVRPVQGPAPVQPPSVDDFETYNTHSAPTLTFTPISTTCGPRVVKAYYVRGSDAPRVVNADGSSPPKHLMVRPGQNFVTIVLTVPNPLP